MTAYYDFFRYVKLYSPDGTTLEATVEADSVTDSINFVRGNGVAWNTVDVGTDTFKFDVDYSLSIPLASTDITLTDVNNATSTISLVAGGNMIITRDNANQLTIAALVGGVSKSIQNITTTNPVVITTTNAHAFTDGTEVTIVDVVGTTQLNGNEYFMDVQTSDTFALYTDAQLTTPLDGTTFTAYVSGGVATADYGGAKNAFKTIQVTGQSPVVADNIQDILNLTGGTGIDITTTPGTDSIAWAIDNTVTTLADAQTLTNKTLTSPIIAAIKPSASNSWSLPDSNDTFVGKATTDTFTNKSVDLANNTLTTTIAQLNTAVSDESVVARDTTDTLTNKTIATASNTITVVEADISDFGSYLPTSGGVMTGYIDHQQTGITGFMTTRTDGDGQIGPLIFLTSNSTSARTINGQTGGLIFNASNSVNGNHDFASIISTTTNFTDGAEAGYLSIGISTAGIEAERYQLWADKIAFAGQNKLEWTNHTSTHEYILQTPATIAGAVTVTLPNTTDTLVGKATTDTFTNKSGSNSQWTNDEAYIKANTTDTLTNKSISLTTNTVTGTLVEFNTAVSDATLVSTTGTETLTNKTLTSPTFSGTATSFTSTGIDDNATGTRITVTDGSVGIGQASLTSEPKLVVGAGGFKIQGGGHPGTYNPDEFIIDFDPTTGNGTARLWAIGDASAKGSYQFHVRDTAGSPADTTPLVITGGATDTVQVAAAADFVTPNISGSIPGMTFVMTIGGTATIGDGATTVTRYATPGNDWQATLAIGTSMPVTSNMKCVAMSVLSDGALTVGSSNVTLMKNGVDTTTSVTFANGDGGTGDVKQSTVNNSFDAGDRVGIKVVTLSATARAYLVMTQWELI